MTDNYYSTLVSNFDIASIIFLFKKTNFHFIFNKNYIIFYSIVIICVIK